MYLLLLLPLLYHHVVKQINNRSLFNHELDVQHTRFKPQFTNFNSFSDMILRIIISQLFPHPSSTEINIHRYGLYLSYINAFILYLFFFFHLLLLTLYFTVL